MPKKTFEQAADTHGLLIQLKDNQQNLLEDIGCLAKTIEPCQTHTVKNEAGHGRITTRATSVYQQNISDFILDEQWANHVKTVVKVTRNSAVSNTKTKQYDNRGEIAFYLSNRLIDADEAHQAVINHWGIENRNHYVRDVSLQEDNSRIRKNAFNISVLRSLAINIFRKNSISNIKGELYENSLNWTKVFSYPQVT